MQPGEDLSSVSAGRLLRCFVLALVVIPFLGFIAAMTLLWRNGLGGVDVGLLVGVYAVTTAAVRVGFHRQFAHRAFRTNAITRVILAIAGSMAAQGPVIYWAATHRRCAIGSWGGRRPSLGGYVTVTRATDGASAAGGRSCRLSTPTRREFARPSSCATRRRRPRAAGRRRWCSRSTSRPPWSRWPAGRRARTCRGARSSRYSAASARPTGGPRSSSSTGARTPCPGWWG